MAPDHPLTRRGISCGLFLLLAMVTGIVSLLLWLYWPRLTMPGSLAHVGFAQERFTLDGIAIEQEAMKPYVDKEVSGWLCVSDPEEGWSRFQFRMNSFDDDRIGRNDIAAIYHSAVGRVTEITGRPPTIYRWEDAESYPRQSAVWEGSACHVEIAVNNNNDNDAINFYVRTGSWKNRPEPKRASRVRVNIREVDADTDPRGILRPSRY